MTEMAAKWFRGGRFALLVAALTATLAVRAWAENPAVPSDKATAAATSPKDRDAVKSEAAEHAEAEIGMPETAPNIVEFRTDLAIWSFLVFLVLLGILTKFAWKPIVAGLAKREQGIEDHIAAAKRANDDAKKVLADYDKRLAGAADQVRLMLDQARRDAEQTKLEIVAEAKSAAQLEQQRVVREVRIATDSALKELSEKSTQLAIELAGKIVKRQLTPEDHARLAQEALAQFAARSASVN